MTIVDVLSAYPNIDFGYVKTHIPIVEELPEDYRWADCVEVDYWWHIEGAVQVRRGKDQTDIAIPISPLLDTSAYHS